jgi:hypothetical protein
MPHPVRTTLRVLRTSCSRRTQRLTLECLQLRALAAALLRTAPAAAPAGLVEASLRASLACSPIAWRLFLMTERCADPLLGRLRETAGLERLPADVRSVVEEIRNAEVQRALAARGQLIEIARVATDLDAPTIVLKGGVAALTGGRYVDVSDVDILPPHGRAEEVAARLDSLGYDALLDGPVHHLPRRRARGALPVEVHHAMTAVQAQQPVGFRERAVPLAAAPGLLKLAPADHLWSLLLHVGIQHFERRCDIRDHLLIRDAVAECTAADLDTVRSRIRSHPDADLLSTVLAAADAPATPFNRLAATRYAAVAAIFADGQPPPGWVWRSLLTWSMALGCERARYWGAWHEVVLPGARNRFVEVRQWSAPTAQLLIMAGRTLRLFGLSGPAALLALTGRRAARMSGTDSV